MCHALLFVYITLLQAVNRLLFAINHQIGQFPDQKFIPMLQSKCFDEQRYMLKNSSIRNYAVSKQMLVIKFQPKIENIGWHAKIQFDYKLYCLKANRRCYNFCTEVGLKKKGVIISFIHLVIAKWFSGLEVLLLSLNFRSRKEWERNFSTNYRWYNIWASYILRTYKAVTL